MKIYHTETQEDYDALVVELEEQGCKWALMIELERQGCAWASNRKLTKVNNWPMKEHLTCLRVYDSKVNHESLNYYKEKYPDIPITKYKAKADDKMRFTKENVYRLAERYDVDENYRADDFESDIFELEYTPEKVVVPKCFDEWYKEIEAVYPITDNAKTFALWKLCQQGFGHGYEDVHGKKIPYKTDLGEWLFENKMLAIDAVLNGYTIEPEQLYYIPLPHLETSDGIQQVLSKRKNDTNYFASRPNDKLKQRYTKEEIAQVPEIYKFYATLIEESE